MSDILPTVAEAIKISFSRPKMMKVKEINNIKEEKYIGFEAFVQYEIIGAFLRNDRIIVVVLIHQLICSDLVQDYVMNKFQTEVEKEIAKKIPESLNHVDICPMLHILNMS